MVVAAMTSGDLLIEDAIWEHNRPLLSKMRKWLKMRKMKDSDSF